MVKAKLWRFIVKLRKVEEKSKGGIILAPETIDKLKVSAQLGTVVDIGPDCFAKEEVIAVGDVVGFARHAGWNFEYDGENYLVLNDEDLMFVAGQEDLDKIEY